MTASRPGTTWGGFSFAVSVARAASLPALLEPSMLRAGIPVLPRSFLPLVWPPMASRRLFCVRVQQGGAYPKNNKPPLRPFAGPSRHFAPLWLSLYSRAAKRPTEAAIGPRRAQSNPGPLRHGVDRGIIICSGPERAQRSGSCQRPTRSRSRPCTGSPPTLQTPARRRHP